METKEKLDERWAEEYDKNNVFPEIDYKKKEVNSVNIYNHQNGKVYNASSDITTNNGVEFFNIVYGGNKNDASGGSSNRVVEVIDF